VRVVIADDSVLLREGLSRVLADAGLDVVARVGDAYALREAVGRFAPDVAIVDVRMPPTYTDEGTRAAQEIREKHPGVGVLVLSQVLDTARALRMMSEKSGGFGYLLKDRVLDVDEFVDAVRRVGRGGSAIDADVVSELVARQNARDPLDDLTPRERDVLALIAAGHSNQAISGKLYLSPKTVETHVHRIFQKLKLAPTPEGHRRVLAVLAYLGPGGERGFSVTNP
jgi:DNA-binding NarL/FixJ family response regulator